jgi:hypothetical protein
MTTHTAMEEVSIPTSAPPKPRSKANNNNSKNTSSNKKQQAKTAGAATLWPANTASSSAATTATGGGLSLVGNTNHTSSSIALTTSSGLCALWLTLDLITIFVCLLDLSSVPAGEAKAQKRKSKPKKPPMLPDQQQLLLPMPTSQNSGMVPHTISIFPQQQNAQSQQQSAPLHQPLSNVVAVDGGKPKKEKKPRKPKSETTAAGGAPRSVFEYRNDLCADYNYF